MIRTQKMIDIDSQRIQKNLEDMISENIQAEKFYKTEIKMLQESLQKLSNETCFVDTLEGQKRRLELEADKKIMIILSNLKHQTGEDYAGIRIVL